MTLVLVVVVAVITHIIASVASFNVRASQGVEVIAATPLSRVKVSSVGMSNGAINLQLANGRTVPYDQARAFM